MTKEQCARRIIEVFPEYRDAYYRHMEDYGELLLHVFAMETISEPLRPLLKRHGDVGTWCGLIESMWRDGDDAVRNVVDVTILEDLSDDEEAWRWFGEQISQDFRDYINKDLLAHNLMMAAVKPL